MLSKQVHCSRFLKVHLIGAMVTDKDCMFYSCKTFFRIYMPHNMKRHQLWRVHGEKTHLLVEEASIWMKIPEMVVSHGLWRGPRAYCSPHC